MRMLIFRPWFFHPWSFNRDERASLSVRNPLEAKCGWKRKCSERLYSTYCLAYDGIHELLYGIEKASSHPPRPEWEETRERPLDKYGINGICRRAVMRQNK